MRARKAGMNFFLRRKNSNNWVSALNTTLQNKTKQNKKRVTIILISL